MPKIAIVVGHNLRQKGAVRVTDNVAEFDWNSRLADLIVAHDPDALRVFYREPGGGYSREIDRVYAAVDAWGADASVELHFNAAGSPAVEGTETLTSGTTGSVALAEAVQVQMVRVMGGRDRGLKRRGRHDRGGRSLWQGRAPAILVEPYFGSHAPSCLRADEAMDELAEAIVRGAAQFFGLAAPSAPPAPAPVPDPLPEAAVIDTDAALDAVQGLQEDLAAAVQQMDASLGEISAAFNGLADRVDGLARDLRGRT